MARGGSQEPGGAPGQLGGGGAGLSLTLLQLDVAASFDLCDPAVVNGPRGLCNRHGVGSGPLGLCSGAQKPSPQPVGASNSQQMRDALQV